MPGARPTIASRAAGSPNDGTGEFKHSGWRARASPRKLTSRGQSGQLRSGSEPGRNVTASGGLPFALTFLVLEIVVITPRRRGGRALQELRRMMTRLARSGTLGRIAAELGLQFHEIGEDVGLAPQFVGDHRGRVGNVEHPRQPDAPPRAPLTHD